MKRVNKAIGLKFCKFAKFYLGTSQILMTELFCMISKDHLPIIFENKAPS